MTKKDLKYGNVVETRNGFKFLYHSINGFISLNGEDWIKLENDLIYYRHEYDVIKVYADYTCKTVLWVREEISDDEKAILRNVPHKWQYLARDETGDLYLYEDKPYKSDRHLQWNCDGINHDFKIYNDLFQFIQWEDENPYLIRELLGE